jgi:dihydrofolate reductase
MTRIVVSEFISLDGIIEDPGGAEGYQHGGWAFQFERGEAGDKFKVDELMAAGAMLLGRVTYEGFAAAWPSMQGDAFGAKMNGMPKYVVSKTLTDPAWNNTTVLAGDPVQEIKDLMARVDGDILVAGSASLAQLLAAHDLVDEYRLMVFPTLLGHGKKLFGAADAPQKFTVVESGAAGDTLAVVLHRT